MLGNVGGGDEEIVTCGLPTSLDQTIRCSFPGPPSSRVLGMCALPSFPKLGALSRMQQPGDLVVRL